MLKSTLVGVGIYALRAHGTECEREQKAKPSFWLRVSSAFTNNLTIAGACLPPNYFREMFFYDEFSLEKSKTHDKNDHFSCDAHRLADCLSQDLIWLR